MGNGFYRSLSRHVRTGATFLIQQVPAKTARGRIDLRKQDIRKILLVRANFRMGNSLLAIPAIELFRRNFPEARIDFVGSAASKVLYRNLPVDHHFVAARRFPGCVWQYPALLRQLRTVGYDLAVEVSCSQSALGAFITGMSGARLTAGRAGKRDFWYNLKIPKPAGQNKYRLIPELVAALGLKSERIYPKVILSSDEVQRGRERIAALVEGDDGRQPVGVFVGAKTRTGKRWQKDNFLKLVEALKLRGVAVVVFAGPEEKDIIEYFRQTLPADIKLVCERDLRTFAAMVAQCRLFVTCDSGPMHLACSLGVRTIAIFQNHDFHRWGPPDELCRVIHEPQGVSVEAVESACDIELNEPPESRLISSGGRLDHGIAEENPR